MTNAIRAYKHKVYATNNPCSNISSNASTPFLYAQFGLRDGMPRDKEAQALPWTP